MTRDPLEIMMFVLLGLAAGMLGGWLGIGGGALMVPMLILLAGFETKAAVATSLAVIIAISISGTIKHWSAGKVDLAVVIPMAMGGLVGGVIGAWLLDQFDVRWTKRALAVFWVIAAYKLWMSTMPKTDGGL